MSEGNKKYGWQKIEISPHNSTEILDQMEFLHKLLDIVPLEEQLAIHEELSRLSKMHSAAFAGEMDKRIEAARQLEQQAAQRAARQADPWFQLRRTCYELRFIIWLLLPGFLIMLLMLPSSNRDLPWMFPTWCVMFTLYLVWAIWGSKVPEE